MKSLSETFDLIDRDGQRHSFSKMIIMVVVFSALGLLTFDAIDRTDEAVVLGALVTAAFGLDWGKSYLKTNGKTE